MDDLRQSIVGILSKTSSPKFAGTGFFVMGGLILTCAHVVDDARALNGKIVFIIEGQDQWQHAELVFKSDAATALDIAILRPIDLPETPPALPLIASRSSNGHKLTTFGYPLEGHDSGLYGDGEIQNWVRDSLDRDRLQISSDKITHGFSGGPIWDDDLGGVVGMVSKGLDIGLDKKLGTLAFAVPSEILQSAYPALQLDEVEEKSESSLENASANIGNDVNNSIIAAGRGNVINIFNTAPAPSSQPANLQPATVVDWHFAHHYGDSPNFTGRDAERKLLTDWLNGNKDTLFILRALGGFGKSALSWYWLHHDVDKSVWKYAAWWSFYEGDASFENFLTDTLEYLGAYEAVKMHPRQQARVLLEKLQTEPILLVLDGFERVLRAFSGMNAAYQGDDGQDGQELNRECVLREAEDFLRGLSVPNLRGKVLITTRYCPSTLEKHDGVLQARCVEKELTALTPEDAYLFFQKEMIKATRAEVQTACAPYAYHPLSLNLLAGLIKKDYEYPYDIRAAQKYILNDEIKNHKAHILKVAYETLSAEHQKVLSSIACLRGGINYDALTNIFSFPYLNDALHELEERGLLQVFRLQSPNHQIHQSPNFDLHPIVRRYAYERFAAPDRTQTHILLIVYFEAVPKRKKIEKLDDLAPLIELYHHMVNSGRLDEAVKLFYARLNKATYYQFGAYRLRIELLLALFPNGENNLPHLTKEDYQAWTLNGLANSYAMSGQSRRAIPMFEMQNALREKDSDKKNLAIGLGNMAQFQLVIGALTQGERNLRRSIDLCREIDNELLEAVSHKELGCALSYRSDWQAAEQELLTSRKAFDDAGPSRTSFGSGTFAHYALRWLLMARETQASNLSLMIDYLQYACIDIAHALKLADETARTSYPVERDYIRAYWLLGAACRALAVATGASDEMIAAENHLSEALRRCRAINLVEREADILLELAKLRHAQGDTPEALRLAQEALIITERSEYALQGADVHLFLAELALVGQRLDGEVGTDRELALRYAQKARQLATGWEMIDGVQVYDTTGQYVYKVAYDEAGRLIERLKSEG